MSVLQQTVSLAAQLRASSSLSSSSRTSRQLQESPPSARYRLKPMSLILPAFSSPDLKAFPHCSKSSKSSEGGQSWPLRAQWRDSVFHFVPATDSPDTRISVMASVVLSDCCTSGGKTLISRINLCPSATCRGLRPCLLWHLWPVSASAYADAKTVPKHHRPTHFRPLVRHCRLDRHLPPEGMYLDYINSKGMHLTAIASRCFYCVGNIL